MVCIQMRDKTFQPRRLLAEVSGRANQQFELFDRRVANTGNRQYTCRAQILHRPFHIRPGSVLGQICAHHDLECRARRPPVLRAHCGFERTEDLADTLRR